MKELDGLRGCAVLAIVRLHYVVHHLQAPPGTLLAYGQKYSMALWMGVDAFFVLSGFLIAGILMDNREAPNYFRVFYLRRALRIFPPYLMLLCAWTAASGLAGVPGMAWLLEPSFPAWPYFLYLQNFWMAAASSAGPNFVAATWSLAVEEQFYLLFPFVVRWFSGKTQLTLLWAAILCAPALRLGLAFLGAASQEAQVMLLPARMDALLLGAAIAWIVRQHRLVRAVSERHDRILLLLAVLGVLVALVPLAVARPNPFASPWRAFAVHFLVAAFFAVVLLTLHVRALPWLARILSNEALCALGRISYFVYLFHTAMLGLVFALVLGREPERAHWTDWAAMSSAFAATIVLARASWRWIEAPLIAYGHRFHYGTTVPSMGTVVR